MAKLKYKDGNEWKQIAPSKEEFDSHLADLASQEVGKGASLIGINDADTLFTATNIEGALKELFTNVSSGKILVGGAITGVDDSVVIPTDPTFEDLVTAIGQINTGKKWASGTAPYSNMSTTKSSFTLGDGTTYQAYMLPVNGLDFIPTLIIAIKDGNTGGSQTIYKSDGFMLTGDVKIIASETSNRVMNGTADVQGYKLNSPAVVDESGFTLPVLDYDNYYWTAFE